MSNRMFVPIIFYNLKKINIMSITPTILKIQDEFSQSSDSSLGVLVRVWIGDAWVGLNPELQMPQNPYFTISPEYAQVSESKNAVFELEINPAAVRELGESEEGGFLSFSINNGSITLGTDGTKMTVVDQVDTESFRWEFEFNGWTKDVIIELKDVDTK